ncbi:hypothetical protein GNI_029660 [Gregarina niphandrodes]|uniref:Uncharacterized protein n=1 Tax=Gregarina niphandrodes TaxID=110365 RepID=A0A023BB98_GRENI|nr:hypothetical protein GNI_029660 [Gregarina niphandrodes]EZG79052.1 hypothetical protein GNI_029660 [Gregarina niphandrodes]|eukprot:XP_011129136.1 hypothetical protein GNI_029660 [Gregarina niphandrodes]
MSETEVEQLGSPRFIRTGNHRAALPEGLSPNSPDPDSLDENDLSLLVERLGKPLSYASIGYWNDELVKIAYEEERRSIQLHYLDPAEAGDWSRDRVKRAINAAISLLEDDQLATRLNWMFVCPNHTYAETVRTRFAAYANSANLVAQRQLFVHMVTEDSGPQAILNLFLRQRHPGRRGARDLTITSHTLLQSAPYFFPQDVDVVIDMGLQTVSTKFPWNNQLQYNITSQLTSDDLLTRTAAAGRFSGRRLTRLANGRRKEGDDVDVEYFVCASEDMISDSTSTVGSPSSANASLIIPSLLMSLLRPSTGGNIDKNVGGEVMDGVGSIYGKLVLPKLPFAPVVEGVLQLLANTGCVNGIGGLVETRCYNFMGWLGLLEDEWLAALMTNSEEAGCVGEAAAISAMLLKCPHPFEETRSGVSKIDRLRLNQLYFAVSEGDFMTLGNVLFEFSQHDQQWCRSHGLKWQQLTDAQMYHCQLVEFYKSKTGAKVPSNALEIAKVLTNTFLPSMAELRADNEYRLIRHTLFPGMKNNLPCSNEDIVIHLAQDSVAHVQPCLPSKITFWKGVADGTILSSEVGVSKRMDMSDSLKWPVFVSHYHRVGA